MENKKNIYFIPHTHWDREWYFSINDAAILSTMSFLKAIETLENNPDYPAYNFDAQTSIVDDLLELRPDLKPRIEKLVKEKRLFIGPWYTQTDTFYADGESIIRNLYFGTKDANKLGRTMKIGYLPDTFGHNIQMPQIFSGFGIENIIFWRGYNPEKTPEPFFAWRGIDGTEILAANITFGYSGLRYNIIRDAKNFDSKFVASADKLFKLTEKENLFLPLGGDQELINEHLMEDVDKLNKHVSSLGKDYEFSVTDYETYIDILKKEVGALSNLQTFEEELRDPVKARIHRTIGSSRYDIKKLSFELEHKLVNILEPLSIIVKEKIDKDLVNTLVLEKAWKLLLDGHAHDSLGGCNTDITNENVMNRFKKANDLIEGTINILQKTIGVNIDKKYNKKLVIYNFDTKDLDYEWKEIKVYSTTPKVEIKDGDMILETIPVGTTEVPGGKLVTHTAKGDVESQLPPYYLINLMLKVSMKSFGYKALDIIEVKSDHIVEEEKNNFIENNIIKIEAVNNKINVMDKIHDKLHEDVVSFENIGNDGDSYDFSPMKGDMPITDVEIFDVSSKTFEHQFHKLFFKVKMTIPEKANSRTERSNKLVDLIFDVVATLNDEKIDFKLNVKNIAKDHRVRLLFSPQINSKKVVTDVPFGFIEREYVKEPENWKEFMVEKPVNYYPILNTFFKEDSDSQFIVNTKGIKEIEILENSNVFLTLWKSDEFLGKDDLEFRPNRASGMNNKIIKTPDAQLFDKDLEFEFQMILTSNKTEEDIHYLRKEYISKFDWYQLQKLDILSQNLERWSFPIKDYEISDEVSLYEENKSLSLVSSYVSYIDGEVVFRYLNMSNSQSLENLNGTQVNMAEEKVEQKNNISKYQTVTIK